MPCSSRGAANVVKSQGRLAVAKVLYDAAQAIYERNGGLDRELTSMSLAKARIWPVLPED